MYKFYRTLWNGKWKYCETFNSTLDPEYHDLINYCTEEKINWKLVSTYDNIIKYSSLANLLNTINNDNPNM